MKVLLEFLDTSLLLDPTSPYTIGRAAGVDILIQNNMISRRHCRFSYADGKWTIVDLGSAHGTWIEGKSISNFIIKNDFQGTFGGARGIPFRVKVLLNSNSFTKKFVSSLEVRGPEGPRVSLKQRLTIGSDTRNDWVINDLTVSDFHAEVNMASAGKYELIDLKSKNGSFVNGLRVQRNLLTENDIIRIGGDQKRFTLDGLEDLIGPKGARVSLENISYKAEGNVFLLRDINLKLGPATLTAIVGPSGAGKSTLMDVIIGKKKISHGLREIRLEGENTDSQKIGFVPQANILHTKLTVQQALMFGAALRFPSGTSKKECESRVNEVLKLVELESRADLRIDKLSGGQRKRCSIALELLSKPDVLVLDEPTSGLDPGLDLHFMELMRNLTREGQTVIVVTHAVENVDICDNVVLLRTGGTLAYAGPPGTVFYVMKEKSWAHIFRSLSIPNKDLTDPTGVEYEDNGSIQGTVSQQSFFSQTLTLCQRYIAVIVADKFYLALLVILPVTLGFIGYASGNDYGLSFGVSTKGQDLPNPQARMLALILVLGSVFLALAASIQEIVKEIEIRGRESGIGVRVESYLFSKFLILGLIVSLQLAGFFSFAFLGRDAGESSLLFASSKTEIFMICFALGMCSMVLGLLISTLITSQEQGMPTLVLTTMAQVVISGALPIRIDWLTDTVGMINPAYWAMNAIGASTDMNRISALQGSDAFSRWNNLISNVQVPLFVLFLILVLAAILSTLNLHRKR